MIWIQPRTLKSFTVANAFPCWLLGRKPSAKIMVATYGEALSSDHVEARRRIMTSDWYWALFSQTHLAPRGNSGGTLTTTKGGIVRSVSVAGLRRGHLFEPLVKASDAQLPWPSGKTSLPRLRIGKGESPSSGEQFDLD